MAFMCNLYAHTNHFYGYMYVVMIQHLVYVCRTSFKDTHCK